MQLVPCRTLHPYRQERLDAAGLPVVRGGAPVVDEHDRGTVVKVTAAELAQDRARRFPLLRTLEEERAARAAEEERQAELERQGVIEVRDQTAEMVLTMMQAQHQREGRVLSINDAWEELTGSSLLPE